jgi:hypothetical protein
MEYKGIDPGQNNEGHGVLTLTAPQSSATNRAANPSLPAQASPGIGANTYLASDSIAIRDARDGAMRIADGQALLFEPARVRLKVYSDTTHREYAHVMLYDGNPEQDGTLIADKIVHSGNPDGAHVWLNWAPKTTGRHELFARVLKDRDDPVTDKGTDTMVVMVMRQNHFFPFVPLTGPAHPK